MPKRNKAFYIDTNVALDYITARNREAILVLDKIKERGWKCVSSSFFAMELAEYKKESLFVIEKAMEKKWEMRKILRETYKKDLRRGDFDKVLDWFNDFRKGYSNIELYDFLKDNNDWQVAQGISFNTNLNAPDAIHLASAMLGAIGGHCQIMITNDQHFIQEARRFIGENKPSRKLQVMTISEVKKKFFKNIAN
jgi:predicted nucleic acid-binding protein